MARILYFDPRKLGGHRLEYLHHYYEAALQDKNNDYVIITGYNFYDLNKDYNWPDAPNITIELADKDYMDEPSSSLFLMSLKRSFYLRKLIKKYSIDKVFLVNMINNMPFLPFFVYRKVVVKGIIYSIPFYKKEQRFIRKIRNHVIYYLFAKCRIFDKIYLLNSNDAVDYYNKKYSVDKFKFLPDPFACNDKQVDISIRNKYNIPDDNIIFTQFGYLSINKGTCNILKCFSELPDNIKSKVTLILAGQIELSSKKQIIEFEQNAIDSGVMLCREEGFVSFDLIYALCRSSNFLLMPYLDTSKSSGMFGYSSYFNIPLIAPDSGLIGEIVKRYDLGYCLKDISTEGLKSFIQDNLYDKRKVSDDYIQSHSLKKFESEIIG